MQKKTPNNSHSLNYVEQDMSLYYLQKLFYELNRDESLQVAFRADQHKVLETFELTEEERAAVVDGDIGLLYVLGVNGQLLMHYAAFCGLPWPDYIQAMRDGIDKYGQVRAGLYAMTDGKGAI